MRVENEEIKHDVHSVTDYIANATLCKYKFQILNAFTQKNEPGYFLT